MVDVVTGATGFVGSHLVEELLERGRALRAAVRRSSDRKRLERLGVECVEADLAAGPPPAALFEGAEVVYHLAGTVFGDAEAFVRGNVTATRNLTAALPAGVRRLVHVSSLAACGPQPTSEEAEPRPVSDYGRSKLAGEREARRARVPVTIVRPPVVYGPRDRGLLTFFAARGAGLLPLMPPERRLSLVHARDLARGMVEAAAAPAAAGRTYFLCGAETPTFDAVMDMIGRAVGPPRNVTVRLDPGLMAEAGALADWAQRLTGRTIPFSRDKVRELRRRHWICSPQAARRDFGWEARVEPAAGFRQTAAWYRTRGWI